MIHFYGTKKVAKHIYPIYQHCLVYLLLAVNFNQDRCVSNQLIALLQVLRKQENQPMNKLRNLENKFQVILRLDKMDLLHGKVAFYLETAKFIPLLVFPSKYMESGSMEASQASS